MCKKNKNIENLISKVKTIKWNKVNVRMTGNLYNNVSKDQSGIRPFLEQVTLI